MKRVVANKENQDIELRQCVASKWYGCRSNSGAIYVLGRSGYDLFTWFCMSTLGKGTRFCDTMGHFEMLEAGTAVGHVFQFDSLTELGFWLAEENIK